MFSFSNVPETSAIACRLWNNNIQFHSWYLSTIGRSRSQARYSPFHPWRRLWNVFPNGESYSESKVKSADHMALRRTQSFLLIGSAGEMWWAQSAALPQTCCGIALSHTNRAIALRQKNNAGICGIMCFFMEEGISQSITQSWGIRTARLQLGLLNLGEYWLGEAVPKRFLVIRAWGLRFTQVIQARWLLCFAL